MDRYSRRIVGEALVSTQATSLVMDALHMAIGRRQLSASLLQHSDRGSQYASIQYQDILQMHRLTICVSGIGKCYENAAIESFFGTLKAEPINCQSYQTRERAQQEIVSYIEGF